VKIRPVAAGLNLADRHDEANSSSFSNAPKNTTVTTFWFINLTIMSHVAANAVQPNLT